MIFTLANLSPPFDGENLIELGKSIMKENPKEIPMVYSTKL